MQHSLTRGRRTLPGCPSLCEAAAAYPGQRFPQNTAAALPPRSRASQTSPPPRPSPTHSRVSPSPLHQRCVLLAPRWLSGIQSTLPERMEERVGAPARRDRQPCTRLCAPSLVTPAPEPAAPRFSTLPSLAPRRSLSSASHHQPCAGQVALDDSRFLPGPRGPLSAQGGSAAHKLLRRILGPRPDVAALRPSAGLDVGRCTRTTEHDHGWQSWLGTGALPT